MLAGMNMWLQEPEQHCTPEGVKGINLKNPGILTLHSLCLGCFDGERNLQLIFCPCYQQSNCQLIITLTFFHILEMITSCSFYAAFTPIFSVLELERSLQSMNLRGIRESYERIWQERAMLSKGQRRNEPDLSVESSVNSIMPEATWLIQKMKSDK